MTFDCYIYYNNTKILVKSKDKTLPSVYLNGRPIFWQKGNFGGRQNCLFACAVLASGSALLPFASFRLSRQQVDDEPMKFFHYLYRRGEHKCACTCLFFSLETLQRAGRRTAEPALNVILEIASPLRGSQ